jgi:predicted metalloprotease with PDZ domain
VKIQTRLLSTIFVLLFIISCSEETTIEIPVDLTDSFYYEINLNDRRNDTFKVRLLVDNLTEANAVFQFPATVPGTYHLFHIGRYVTSLKAFDVHHRELSVIHSSTNQWILSNPASTRFIEYEVKETFDTPVTDYPIYRMAGTSLEDDHTLLNSFDVLGYPAGLKERNFYINIDHPSSWSVGTSLPKDENGFYYATDYDKLVDSPLLLGTIASANTTVGNTAIGIHTYSKNNLIQASQILTDIQQILTDASAFLNGLPTDNYHFIYFFDQFNAGALEHSYSSVYVLRDQLYSPAYGQSLRDISAHEFFHIVTPLNIHSEIIEDFNFAEPTPSEHLWLYEGVTEWASLTMQFRNGHLSLANWLERFGVKKSIADNYRPSLSLSEISLKSYTEIGVAQFNNVYNKGALVAALLDIRLLELSNGTKGLREVILQLIKTYGPANAFSEKNFFADLTSMTYPEIGDFLNRYIKGTEPLPVAEFFDKIGITYNATANTFTVNPSPTASQQNLFNRWRVNF